MQISYTDRNVLKIRLTRSANSFADFSLEESAPGKFLAGEAAKKIPEKWLRAFDVDFDALVRRHMHQTAKFRKASGAFEKNFHKTAAAFTKLLFDTEMERDLTFREDRASPAVFVIDKEYASLPFEALSDGRNFLCDLRPVLRVLRLERRPPTAAHAPRRSTVYIAVSAPEHPRVLESAIRERSELSRLMQATRTGPKVRVDATAALRLPSLLENFQDADFLHFAGHGSASGIALAGNENLSPDDIAHLKLARVKAVFLNACSSASQEIRDSGQATFAEAFVTAGVQNFIGYSEPIANKAAEICYPVFWKNYLNGDDAATALFDARQRLRKSADFSEYRFFLRHFGNTDAPVQKPDRLWIKIAMAAVFAAAGFFIFQILFRAKDAPRQDERQISKVESPPKVQQELPKDQSAKNKRTHKKGGSAGEAPAKTVAPSIKALLDKFAPVSLKSQFLPEDIELMNRIWRHMEENTDKGNFVCGTNLQSGNKAHGRTPIGRRQIIRNLLVFRCIPEAPIDWDFYVRNSKNAMP